MVIHQIINITLFMFALESVLLEKKVIRNIKQLDWPIVENYKNYVVRYHPYFTLDYKQFKSFMKNYTHRRMKLQNRKQPVDFEPLKDLLREYDATRPGAEHQLLQPSAPIAGELLWRSEMADLRSEMTDLRSEMADLRKLVESKAPWCFAPAFTASASPLRGRAETASMPTAPEVPSGDAVGRVGLLAPGASHQLEQQRASLAGLGVAEGPKLAMPPLQSTAGPSRIAQHCAAPLPEGIPDFKRVLHCATSKRPFARARQRVALLVIYITGWNVSKLLTLEVRHLKALRKFAPGSDPKAVKDVKSGAQHQAAHAQVAEPPTVPMPLTINGVPVRCEPLQVQELIADLLYDLDLLMVDCSDNTPAFRASPNGTRPCTRAGFTHELNQRLSPWKLTTKSLQGEGRLRRTKDHSATPIAY